MAQTQLAATLRHIHRLAGVADGPPPTDTQLLQRFLADRDEAAFAALVERHGRMVFGVCRQVLQQRQDAEDAFQATFLVLARSAASIRAGAALPSWLYGVANRIARNARRAGGRRRWHERRAATVAQAEPGLDVAWRDLQAVLADEVSRLPEKFRAPFVLCCLDGRSKSEAAAQLGWKEGTVSWRLAEARKRLQQRLVRRGLTLSAALCAGAVTAADAATVPPVAAFNFVLGTAVGVSARVLALADGATRTLIAGKAKLATAVLLAIGVAGAGAQVHRGAAAPTAQAPPPAAERPAPAQPNAPEAVTVGGRVLGPGGQPVAGAEVLMTATDDNWKTEIVGRATSGTDGTFRLAAGQAAPAKRSRLIATAPGFGPDAQNANVPAKGDITLRLVKDVPVEGRVLDLEGRPVAGVTVRLLRIEAMEANDLTPVLKAWNPDGNRPSHLFDKSLYPVTPSGLPAPVTTGTDGRFRFTGLGGERMAVLKVEGPTIEHKTLHVLTRPGLDIAALTRPDPEKRMPGMPRATPPTVYGPTFDHLARPSKPIVGTVRDKATGKPVPGAHVNGHGAGAWWEDYASTTADEQGRFRLLGLPKGPTYSVTVSAGQAKGYLPAEKPVADSSGLDPVAADFELVQGVRVQGRVTDKATGRPVVAALWYFPLADNKYFNDLPGNDIYKHGIMGIRTDKDGRFSLLALPGSGVVKFRAEFERENYSNNPYTQATLDPAHRSRAHSIDPNDGLGENFLSAGGGVETLLFHNAYRLIEPEPGTTELACDVTFDRGKTLTGKVVDPDGRLLTGVKACGLTAFGGVASLKDDSFSAVALNPDRPRLLTFLQPERKLVGHATLGGTEAGPVSVQLQPWATLRGRLLDEEGKPLAGATARVSYSTYSARWLDGAVPRPPGADKTDAAGHFVIEGVQPGQEFNVVFQKSGHFRDIGSAYRNLSLKPVETRDLGDIPSKVYRIE
jgi:RNA polymerase sigma factor (sigma-70 family)